MEQNIMTEYIANSPLKAQEHLIQVYSILEEIIGAETTKTFAYQMPTYKAKHNVIHFNASKNHVGIYPGAAAIAAFKDEFGIYEYSKGTLRVKYSQEVPVELIKKLALFSYEINK